ncbi:MAG: peptidyl-prolyl cis-trans isomerase [Candidatus Eremiobacter antarcticus]|nr:peptidylprolyl isomerase [Candidatus Eremiobacteraeota bacterium]MBC5807329.1 peptidylprolyl isomerase [Candidatus Eremiobacteraeota bacterium]PZR63085.1 MAG: peptidyl-prolyl cis-trans isomerase [Candidatus Eremiobacter sp. RRmetagenome_bin22]
MPQREPPTTQEAISAVAQARDSQARVTTSRGDIVFSFYPDDAPLTVASFIKLARGRFYDGLTFHRVVPGFVIQGGCPEGTGSGGPGYQLKAEFNARSHVAGTVAMARSQSPDSAGSQFYICLEDATFLDKQYTVFGQVTAGMDVVKQIKVGDVMTKISIEPTNSTETRRANT